MKHRGIGLESKENGDIDLSIAGDGAYPVRVCRISREEAISLIQTLTALTADRSNELPPAMWVREFKIIPNPNRLSFLIEFHDITNKKHDVCCGMDARIATSLRDSLDSKLRHPIPQD